VGALHPKASFWAKQGIFDYLRSFEDFELRVNLLPEEKDRGDVFEIFIEGYLATQPIAQCVKHWVVGSIPLALREKYRLPSDPTGIDGIYETHDGSHVAYQVKYRRKQNLTFLEVSPFLGITEKFADRVIFTNCASLSDKAIVRTRWVSGDLLRDLSSNALTSIEAWLKQKPKPVVRRDPEPHQVEALRDIKAALKRHERATVVMACGTGKTLVSLWAVEEQKPKTVLVLLPSLLLLRQTLREWSEQTKWGRRFSYICVCSDPTVDLKDDTLKLDKSDTGFRVDTDPALVRRFLKRETSDVKVIFSTYDSSPRVGEGARNLPPIDIAIFDEAHKTVGLSGSAEGYALSDKNFKIRKRLFFTATPKHIDIRHRDREGDFCIHSMDDPSIYGPRAHTLSFATAARKKIICPYKVIISKIDKAAVDDFTRRKGITLLEKDVIAARWVANLISIREAVEHVKATRVISFHSRVTLAEEFATTEPRGIAYHLRDYDVRHVNGKQSSRDRADIIRAFAASPKSILTNAKCLTEGVDIPAVDMIAFIDPRRSGIDIAQAVGRAMRKPRDGIKKTQGYVVVPLFVGMDGNDLEYAIKSERFDAVVDVLNALQDHDDDLVTIIREIKQRKGEGRPFNPRRLMEKVEVIGPRIEFDVLSESIGIAIADRIGSNWDESFGVLLRYKDREGDCLVPQGYVEGNFLLGTWGQNKKKGILRADRIARLDAEGFVWEPFEKKWEKGFVAFLKFKKREGRSLVRADHIEGKFRLGRWVSKQRTKKEEGSLSAEKIARLDAEGFVWDELEEAWERGFAALLKFKKREGHCVVSEDHFEGEYPLGKWMTKQCTNKKRGSLSAQRIARLDAKGFIWDRYEHAWERGFAAFLKFKKRENHCLVSADHIEDEFALGNWVVKQRRDKKRGALRADRVARLDAEGFVWNAPRGFAMRQIKRRGMKADVRQSADSVT
jgi:superfamily II DNA or RNA helicase